MDSPRRRNPTLAATFQIFSLPDVRLAIGDFDGDGKLDIAVSNGTTSVEILKGDGTGAFTAAGDIVVGTTVVSVAAADINGDGKLDLLLPDIGVAGSVWMLVQ